MAELTRAAIGLRAGSPQFGSFAWAARHPTACVILCLVAGGCGGSDSGPPGGGVWLEDYRCPAQDLQEVAFVTVEQSSGSVGGPAERRFFAITSQEQWSAAWQQAHDSAGVAAPALPSVNFATDIVVAAWGGWLNSNRSIVIVHIGRDTLRLIVCVQERRVVDGVWPAYMIRPLHFVRIAKPDVPVEFDVQQVAVRPASGDG